jgi:thiamine biosynthesis lipoprotein
MPVPSRLASPVSSNESKRVMGIFRFGFRAMACGCEVLLVCTDKKEAKAFAALAVEEVSRIERKYSRYLPESIVSRINAAAGHESVGCDDETMALVKYGNTLFESSNGQFDCTAGVLRRGWDFNSAVEPDPAKLSELLCLIGWNRVEQDGNHVRLPQVGMEIDFGGFGKEYAADRAASILHGKGARHGYVNLGGDIRVIGPKPDGSPWTIGIQDPRHKDRTIASIPLYNGALATSGDYERYFVADGKRYCHIINPRTGYPVTHWRSVTVVAPLVATAGSHTTIAMLKEGDGLAFLQNSRLGYLAVDQLGQIFHKNT